MASWYERAILTEEPIPQPNGTTLLTTRVNTVPLMSVEERNKKRDHEGLDYKERYLTSGERRLLYSIFGDQLDYFKIRVNNHVIKDYLGVSVHGTISFSPKSYDAISDFSQANVSVEDKSWLVHEATHVWQEQKLKDYHPGKAIGEQVKYGEEANDYIPDPNLKLSDYRYEQQAKIVQDYYLMLNKGKVRENKNPANPRGPRVVQEYRWIVRRVIPEPLFMP